MHLSLDLPPMNFYHKAFLCWSFQREYDLSKISSWEGKEKKEHLNLFHLELTFLFTCIFLFFFVK